MNLSAAARDATLARSAEDGLLREVDVEPTGARRGMQGADVHAQLGGEFAQRKELRLTRMFNGGSPCARKDVGGNRSKAAVPHAKRIDRCVDKVGEPLLREASVAPQVAQEVHDL